MSNSIPQGWADYRQGDIVDFSNGRAYKLTEWEKEGTPVIRLQNLTGSGKEYYYSNLQLPDRQYCDYGDLLYMWSATFGARIWTGQKAIYHYHIWKVTCDEVNITKLFLYQLLDQKTQEWLNKSNGMGILHVTKGNMEDMLLTLPPLPEQQKIAAILTSVDDVIESTQAQINKLKDLKTGMMQELLTKGIGHSEFKDSPLGRIPKAWDALRLKQVALQIRDGNYGADYPTAAEMLDSGIPFLTSAVIGNDQNIIYKKIKYISAEKHKQLAKAHIKVNDILFTNRGANVGNVALVPSNLDDANIGPQLTFVRVNEEIVSPLFLLIAMQSEYFKVQLTQQDSGSAMNFFGIGTTENFLFAIPSHDEQQKIAFAINSLNEKLTQLESKLDVVTNIKKALMQDLLTGKVRVKVN